MATAKRKVVRPATPPAPPEKPAPPVAGGQQEPNPLEIDRNDLDGEAARNPRMMLKWAEALAKAKKEAKERKNHAKATAARLALGCRNDPEQYGLLKVTDESVKVAVEIHDDNQTALQQLVQAEYEQDMLQAMVMALSEKGEQIGNLTRLHGQAYWSGRSAMSPESQDRRRVQQMRELSDSGIAPPNKDLDDNLPY